MAQVLVLGDVRQRLPRGCQNGPLIAVRDSKHPELPFATVGRDAWGRFTGALVNEQLY
ncbi:DUF397 domain-containing protein [Streptomyces caelestis]